MTIGRALPMICGMAALLGSSALVRGADRPAALGPDQDLFAPARPVGVASELPRSPLADATVFGTERFDSPAEAQARCPRDIVVRVDAASPTYVGIDSMRPTDQRAFMCRSSALSEGDGPR